MSVYRGSVAESSEQKEEYWEPGAAIGPFVRLNVYDLADIGMCVDLSGALSSLNKHTLGLWEVGIFHAGVEIAGVEYSFGYCEYGTGVYACEPRQAGGARFRTSIKMGRAKFTARMVDARLARLASTWAGSSYSLIHRNCCHFCDALCVSLGVGRVPAWVNGLAENLSQITPWPSETLATRAKNHVAFRRQDDHVVSVDDDQPTNIWLLPFCAGFTSCFSSPPTHQSFDEDDDFEDKGKVDYYTVSRRSDSVWTCCGDNVEASPKVPAVEKESRLNTFFQTLTQDVSRDDDDLDDRGGGDNDDDDADDRKGPGTTGDRKLVRRAASANLTTKLGLFSLASKNKTRSANL